MKNPKLYVPVAPFDNGGNINFRLHFLDVGVNIRR